MFGYIYNISEDTIFYFLSSVLVFAVCERVTVYFVEKNNSKTLNLTVCYRYIYFFLYKSTEMKEK